MDTREQAGTFDLFVWGISQQSVSEDPLHVPAHIDIKREGCVIVDIVSNSTNTFYLKFRQIHRVKQSKGHTKINELDTNDLWDTPDLIQQSSNIMDL